VRTYIATRSFASLALLLQSSTGCDAAGDTFQCRLASFLHFLYGAAAILGILFGVVLVVAIRYYRNTRKADDETAETARKTNNERGR
jgi:hypothetical protein